MPKYQHRIDLHRLFLIESRGDTIIVSPKGDPAGFANLNFSTEHAALVALLAKGPSKNVLVDLSGSNYYGAKILGAMSEWSDQTHAQGKQFAVCALSPDMKELLRIFDFEDRWTQFPTREAGIKAIVKESPFQSLRTHWKALGAFACVMLLVGLSFLPWREYYAQYVNERDYHTVMGIWGDMQTLKATNASPVEWRKLQNRARRELEPLVVRLESRAGTRTPQARVAQCLLFATRDIILKRLLVQKSRLELYRPTTDGKEIFWVHASLYMEGAKRIMQGEDISHLNFPQETDDSSVAMAQENGEEPFDPPPEPHDESPLLDGPHETPSFVRPAVAESHRNTWRNSPEEP